MGRLFLLAIALVLIASPSSSAATDSSKLRAQVGREGDHEASGRARSNRRRQRRYPRVGDSGLRGLGRLPRPWLTDKGYEVTVQNFEFPFFEELEPSRLERISPSPQTFVGETDFDVMTYSGSGDTTAQVQPVDTTATPAMHPCYHTACDHLDTVHQDLLDATSDALAHATLWFAMDGL